MSCGGLGGPVFPIFTGDLLPIYIADARDCDGPVDWTGWTLTYELRGPVTITGDVTGDADGRLTIVWEAGDTNFPGDYEVVIIGESPDGKPRTFVAQGYVRISVP
jgi:hypothetical protein